MYILHKIYRRALVLVGLMIFAASSFAGDLKVKRVIILGDTLSDGGSYSQAAQAVYEKNGVTLPENMRFRVLENKLDGSSRVWAEIVSENLGVKTDPNVLRGATTRLGSGDPLPTPIEEQKIGGTNYAELGSKITNSTGPSLFEDKDAGLTAQDVVTQVDRVLADNKGKLNKDDFILILAGSEDAISAAVKVSETAGAAATAAAGAQVQAEIAAGNITVADAINQNFPPDVLARINAASGQAFLAAATAGRKNADEVTLPNAAKALSDQVDRLKNAGAKNIVILTVPVSSADVANGGIARYYGSINESIKKEFAGKDGIVIQTTKLIDAMRNDKARFGFTTDPAAGTNCTGEGFLCIDQLTTNTTADGKPNTVIDAESHPSQQMHSNIADLVSATLLAASQNASIRNSTLGTIRQSSTSIETRLVPGAFHAYNKNGLQQPRKKYDIQMYGNFSGGYFEDDKGQVNPGSKATTLSLNGGADVVLGNNALVGVNVAFNNSDVDFGGDTGGFDSRQFIGTLYGNLSVTNTIFVNAAVSAGHVDLDDITRKFNIGPSEESYTGETTGRYASARVGVGYNHRSGGWTLTPSVSYTYENLKVKGYTESDGIGSLVYGDSTHESSRVSAGFMATYTSKDPYGWKPMFRVTVEHDFNDDDMKVVMGFDKDTLGNLYLARPDDTYGTVSAGVSRNIGESTSLNLNATALISGDGVSGASGGISIKSKF
ncbi:MAG: autotransporter domain-containing protein [Methyloligellaceae bacterium]